MSYSSMVFLFLFLPAVIILYHLIGNEKYQNAILLIASLIFYAWGEPKAFFLFLGIILINWITGLLIEKSSGKAWLVLSVILNLAVLFLFKYLNFVAVDLLHLVNQPFSLILPLGISFYVFSAISYNADVYRKACLAEHHLLRFALYMSMFPKLTLGPIVRYPDIQAQLEHRKKNINMISDGLYRFTIGLSKKVLLANQLAIASDKIFNMGSDKLNTPLAWIGVLSYTLQIYFDFSGYSDMAIGLGKVFGYSFSENFNYPYTATSIRDFWHRWHISLSSWFRDYVYIPLGGNRVSVPRWLLNIMLVWSLTGLWHGAAVNFVLWGVYFGILLILEKFLIPKGNQLRILRWAGTMLLVMYSWVLFNCSSIQQIADYTRCLFSFQGAVSATTLHQLGILYLWPYYIVAVICSGPLINRVFRKARRHAGTVWITNIISAVLLALCIVFLISSSYQPFIYFKF